MDPKIVPCWKELLWDEFQKPYFAELKNFLIEEKKKYRIFPPGHEIFNAFNLTPFEKVKVVILGQDPYHGYGEAHGLCFSVKEGVPLPPSLVNIFKELQDDVGFVPPRFGNLTKWALQGVFLLNTILTVRENNPLSHRNKGWEIFTDVVIRTISDKKEHVVFMLWGSNAKSKIPLIDASKHLILTAAHPSPFSAHNGFFGCRHFSKANAYLISHHLTPIEWQL
ncbi:MAG: uracil-DNA glycosylase [Bacteroidales bacterium]|nr:uracil-DNA glycosylase [Bacteroidales bacterium]